MLLSALWRVPALAPSGDVAVVDNVPTAEVVFTGIGLVFLILLLLIVIVMIQGGIFTALDKRKAEKEALKEKEAAQQAQSSAQPQAAAPAPAPVAPAAPAVEAGIPPEVVAAIIAAVHASSEGAFTLRSVSTSQKGRGSWGLAGVVQSTEPF